AFSVVRHWLASHRREPHSAPHACPVRTSPNLALSSTSSSLASLLSIPLFFLYAILVCFLLCHFPIFTPPYSIDTLHLSPPIVTMESRQQVMYQAEYDIQKLLEMNNPPFAFIDTKLAELQSFVEEIGAANLNLKIEWIQQVETLKDRYEATKIGINEHELIEMHFALQTLMAESRPKIEEIHFKMTEFRGMLSKIPI